MAYTSIMTTSATSRRHNRSDGSKALHQQGSRRAEWSCRQLQVLQLKDLDLVLNDFPEERIPSTQHTCKGEQQGKQEATTRNQCGMNHSDMQKQSPISSSLTYFVLTLFLVTHTPTPALTHSQLPHTPTHPVTHSPTHPLTHSPTHALMHSCTHPLTHSATHSPARPLTHSPTHPLTTHLLTHSPTYRITDPPAYTFSHALTRLPTHVGW
jgi:hypothetical protein